MKGEIERKRRDEGQRNINEKKREKVWLEFTLLIVFSSFL